MLFIFSRANYPTNLFDSSEWRRFARATNRRSILSAQKYFASFKGGAFYLLADDALVVFTRKDDGKIRQNTYKPGSWAWEA